MTLPIDSFQGRCSEHPLHLLSYAWHRSGVKLVIEKAFVPPLTFFPQFLFSGGTDVCPERRLEGWIQGGASRE
jgi:hypothetical protein